MSDEELAECKVKGGKIQVSSRIFNEIMNRQSASLDEVSRLQRAFDLYLMDAEEPFETLLRTEFGHDIHSIDEVDYFGYLTETPFSVIEIDFHKACTHVREIYESLS